MCEPGAPSLHRLGKLAAALAALLLVAAPAFGQEDKGPFDFLKPWLKREIFGQGQSGQPAPTTEEPSTGALPDATGTDATGTPGEAAAAPEAPGAAPLGANGDSALRGSAAPAGEPPPDASAALPAEPDDIARESTPVDIPAPAATALPAEEARPAPLRFALIAGRSTTATMALAAPIADDLGALLGRPVEFLPFPSYDAMIDAQVERRIDGGFYSAPAFAVAEARCGCLDPVVAPRAFDGTLAYHAIVVARADSGIATPAALEGRTVAMGAEDSIGARRMQLAGLMAEGVDPASFAGVIETASAAEAVRLVAQGRAEAAFAWSSLSGSVATGYSRGTLTDLVTAGAIAMPELSIVWRSPAIEHGPFALLRTLEEADKDKIESYFLGLMSAKPEAYDGLNPFYGGGYAPVDPHDYAGLEILAAQDVDALALPEAVAESPPAPAVSEPPPPPVAPAPQQ
jgi:phosphonate transport system substrate-binding protein